MNAGSKNCDAERIARFLRHEMSETELSEFVEHLDGCAACAERLESEVASRNWWDRVEECLADSAYELEPLSGETPSTDASSRDLMVQQVLDHLGPTDDPHRLGRIGNYEIVGVVGSGGMGVVLKAFDPTLDRCVAIKTLSPSLASSGAARRRFSREARAAAAVVHDNVIEIYGVAEADGLPYLVMPYVRGTFAATAVEPIGAAQCCRGTARGDADGSRAGGRPCPGAGPSRHQTGERLAVRGRGAGFDHRFRPGPCGRRTLA